MYLVSLEMVDLHIRRDSDEDDALVYTMIQAASEAVVAYLKDAANDFIENGQVITDTNGNPVNVPYRVQQAVLLMVGYLYRGRDTNPDGAYQMGYLPAPVTALLYPMRKPTLA